MNKWLLDVSALLASFKPEPGAEEVDKAIYNEAWISTVNWSETLAKLVEIGIPLPEAREALDDLPLVIAPFEKNHAELCAEFRQPIRNLGLSLGDRACLATAKLQGLPVMTAERSWAKLDLGIEIRVIR